MTKVAQSDIEKKNKEWLETKKKEFKKLKEKEEKLRLKE